MNEIIVSNAYITVEYVAARQLIYHTIHQPVNQQPDAFKDALEKGTDVLKEHGLCKWLSDDRKNGPLSQDILDWAMNGWYQRTIDAGWRFWGNVVPVELEAAGTLSPVIYQLNKMNLKMHLFTDLDQALAWLDKMHC